jgi:hypothetical protein
MIDVHAFLAFARGLDHVSIHIDDGTLKEFLRLTSPDDSSSIINRIMQCVDVGLCFESATEVTCRGGVRNPRRANQVEVSFIVSFQLQIFQTSSATERIVSNVEYMIGFEIREVGNSTFVAPVFSRLNAPTGTRVCLLPASTSCDCFLRKI